MVGGKLPKVRLTRKDYQGMLAIDLAIIMVLAFLVGFLWWIKPADAPLLLDSGVPQVGSDGIPLPGPAP